MLIKAATVMGVYALAVIGIGVLAFYASPPGAKAVPALVLLSLAGAASIACAVMTMMGKRDRKLGMIGIHAGLLIPAVVALATFACLGASMESTSAFNGQLKATGAVIVAEGSKQPTRNTAYQTVGIGACGALSVVAFVSLLLHRPTVPKNPASDISAPAPAPIEPVSA